MRFIYTTDIKTKEILEKTLPLVQTYSSSKSTFWCFENTGEYQFDKQEESLKFALSDTLLF